jgi:ParB-like chromosome segregation protein Spo0J
VVKALADSIKTIGQLCPIAVRDIPGTENYELVFGRHRLEACGALDQMVTCVVLPADYDVRFWEIDENLMRADLTEDQRREQSVAHAKLKAEVEAEKKKVSAQNEPKPPSKTHPKVATGVGRGVGGGRPKNPVVENVKDDLGTSKATAKRIVAEHDPDKPKREPKPRKTPAAAEPEPRDRQVEREFKMLILAYEACLPEARALFDNWRKS